MVNFILCVFYHNKEYIYLKKKSIYLLAHNYVGYQFFA